MKKINHFTKNKYFDNLFGKSNFAKYLFGPDAGGGFGVYGGAMLGYVDTGSTPVNSHDISVGALYFALYNFDLPQVDAEHPTWTYEEKRQEAIRRIETRSADNLKKGYLPELGREEVTITAWETIETEEGKKMATLNGGQYVTREQLWSHTEQRARSKGEWTSQLEAEKNTQLAMEKAILSGQALGAATWLSHESGKARLLQTWERQEDGSIITKQYDIGRIVGRDLEQIEADQVMREVGKLFGETKANTETNYPHLLTKQTIQAEDVSIAAQKQFIVMKDRIQVQTAVQTLQPDQLNAPLILHRKAEVSQAEENYSHQAPPPVVDQGDLKQNRAEVMVNHEQATGLAKATADMAFQTGQMISNELITTSFSLQRFIKEKWHQRHLVKRSRVFHEKKDRKNEAVLTLPVNILNVPKKLETKQEARRTGTRWEFLENKKGIIKNTLRQKLMFIYRALEFSSISLVGVEAFLYGLKQLNQERKLSKTKDKIPEKILTVKAETKFAGWAKIKLIPQFFRERIKNKRKLVKDAKSSKETTIRVYKKEKRIWVVLKTLAQRFEEKQRKLKMKISRKTFDINRIIRNKPVVEKSTYLSQESLKENINNFIFALFLWLSLSLFRVKKSEKDIGINDLKSAKQKNDISKIDKAKIFIRPDGLIEVGSSVFILLSIIWYLVQIREGGKSQITNHKFAIKKKARKLKKITRTSLPKHAVIFAFNS